MQKIEKWRVEELSFLLNELADLLKKGSNPEWANVFSHFHHESEKIVAKNEFNLNSFNNLVRNVKNCFSGGSSFLNTELWHENPRMRTKLSKDFRLTRARLVQVLSDMERSVVDPIN